MTVLEVVAPGPLTTVQDLGRPGLADLGVGGSGAADRPALRLANRLVANPEGTAALEVTLGGLRLRPDADVLVALAGLGPPPLRPGDRLPVGPPPAAHPVVDVAPVAGPPDGDVELRVRLGPRDDWFTSAARDLLLRSAWTASADSDRVGVRLTGPALERAVPGALQVPPTGRPTLLLADAPLTGGYPVIAVVLGADVDRAAQVRPGQRVLLRAAPGQ